MKANDRIELDLDELEMVNGGLWDEIKKYTYVLIVLSGHSDLYNSLF